MKTILQNALATCLFEIRSSFTVQRSSVSLVLALFPPTMLGLLILGAKFSRTGRLQLYPSRFHFVTYDHFDWPGKPLIFNLVGNSQR